MKKIGIFPWTYFLLILFFPLLSLIISFPVVADKIPRVVGDAGFVRSVTNSLIIAGGGAVFAALLGLPPALFLGKFRVPYSRTLTLLLSLPVFFLPYQFALAWSDFLPQGFLSHLLFSKAGVIFIFGQCFYPVIFWFALQGLSSIPAQEEEAALLLLPAKKVLFKITFPSALPYIFVGFLLTFLISFSNLGVAMYLGVDTLPSQVLIQFSAFYSIVGAVASSIPMMLVGVLVFIFLVKFSKRKLNFQRKQSHIGLVFNDKRLFLFFSIFVGTEILIFVFLPMGIILFKALSPTIIIGTLKEGLRSLERSFLYGLTAGILASLWAVSMMVYKGRKGVFSYTSLLLFLLPSSVVSVMLIYGWRGIPLGVYSSFLLIIFGFMAKFSFIPFKILDSVSENLDPSPWEAGLLCGASPWKVFWKIVFPEVKPWVVIGGVLFLIFSMNELGLSSMLYPPGGEPLVVRIYTLSVNNPIAVSFSLSLLNSLAVLFLVTITFWRGGTHEV